MYIQDYDPGQVAGMTGLKMDIYILGPDQDGQPPTPDTQWSLAGDALGIGLGLPPDDLEYCQEVLASGRQIFNEQPERKFFFTSLGPVRSSHDPQNQLELVKQIRQIRR
jgi:hypothetical protein